MAEISWIKLKTTMFDDEKIRLIQAIPESDAILVIWIRLLVLAGKTNDDGLIYIQRNMPYTDEMLATLFDKPVNTIRLALTTLGNFNMIDLGQDGMIAITNWEKHQNVEGMDKVRLQAAKRNREYRERKKQQTLSISHDVSVTSRDGTDIDKDIDKDIDIVQKHQHSGKNAKALESDFEKLWKLYPNKKGKQVALKAYKRAIKDGVSNKQIQTGIVAYKKYLTANGTDQQYMMHGGTFFNQRSWDDDWSISQSQPTKHEKVPENLIDDIYNSQ